MLTRCHNCGKTFDVRPSRFKIGRGKFCSRECAAESRKAKWQSKICENCGKEFATKIHETKYCCHSCASIASAGKFSSQVFGMAFDPWKIGDVKPDRYGQDLYREPDFNLVF